MSKVWKTGRYGRRVAGALSILAAVAACNGSPASTIPEPLFQLVSQDGLIFMTQNVHPDSHMEALFTGEVITGDNGCLRTASPDAHTVVWPAGYTLDTSGPQAIVLDEDDAVVGTVGESFALAGGEVATLPEAMGFTDADRARSEACPGRYWIVNGAG